MRAKWFSVPLIVLFFIAVVVAAFCSRSRTVRGFGAPSGFCEMGTVYVDVASGARYVCADPHEWYVKERR